MKRTTPSRSKTSSISRVQARKAVLRVKVARPTSGAKKSSSRLATKTSRSPVERYLGHFGVGPSDVVSKKAIAKKAGTKKSSAKKVSAKNVSSSKNFRRAS